MRRSPRFSEYVLHELPSQVGGESGAISNISAHSLHKKQKESVWTRGPDEYLDSMRNEIWTPPMAPANIRIPKPVVLVNAGHEDHILRLAEVMVQGLKDVGFQIQMVMVSVACRETPAVSSMDTYIHTAAKKVSLYGHSS